VSGSCDLGTLGNNWREDRARATRAASISTTLNIYTHVVDASHRQAIEVAERSREHR